MPTTNVVLGNRYHLAVEKGSKLPANVQLIVELKEDYEDRVNTVK